MSEMHIPDHYREDESVADLESEAMVDSDDDDDEDMNGMTSGVQSAPGDASLMDFLRDAQREKPVVGNGLLGGRFAGGNASMILSLNLNFDNLHASSPNSSPNGSLRTGSSSFFGVHSPRRKDPRALPNEMAQRHQVTMKLLRDAYNTKTSDRVIALERKRLKELNTFSCRLILESYNREQKLDGTYLRVNQYYSKRKSTLERSVS
eukprot:EW711897.1.p1 GENE.EW711897.1~~EW711897.1.p1  ORF type:complete len:206 (+),score=40.21 EW711897.1:3-620(+)